VQQSYLSAKQPDLLATQMALACFEMRVTVLSMEKYFMQVVFG